MQINQRFPFYVKSTVYSIKKDEAHKCFRDRSLKNSTVIRYSRNKDDSPI